MPDRIITRYKLIFSLVFLLVPTSLLAGVANVKIIGPDSAYTSHDSTTIALDLAEMLNAAPGFAGSSATSTILSGQSLIEAYYHPSYRASTRAVLDSKYDYLVILPEYDFFSAFPEATFEGALQMSRRALNAGSTPLFVMPRGFTLPLATLGENAYRIGNGCGVEVVPGGYAVNTASLSSPTTTRNTRRQAYLLAATLFTKITGLNAATSTNYVPVHDGTALDVASLAGIAVSTLNTHATTSHYSTSRHNTGAVSYRAMTPPNNRVRYAYIGTSTEQGISNALNEVIPASGHLHAFHRRPTSEGQIWTSTIVTNIQPTFNAAPNEYLFAYGRDTFVQAASLIGTNQTNLMPIVFDRHFDDVNGGPGSTDQLLDDIQSRCEFLQSNFQFYGWKSIPLHLGVARLKDVNPSIIYSDDGTHMTTEHYYMMAAMMFASTLGKDPTPPAGILGNRKSMDGFNVGKQTIKELAFLSETMAFTPESSLTIEPPATLEKARWETFSHAFTAIGGTAPYTWSEVSATGLPAGLSLSPAGVLSGAVTAAPQTWQLVVKVLDSAGAIQKIPFALAITSGVGSLSVTPTTAFSTVIAPGGPVNSAPAIYTLLNPGLTTISWTAAVGQPWLSINASSGTLAAGASVTVEASVNSAAHSLAIGTYTDSITFSNTTNGFGNTTHSVSLRVSAPPVVDAGQDVEVLFHTSSPWSPVVINPLAWFDATDAATITHSSGAVSQWSSKNGSSHMLQGTAARRPMTGTATINGLNTIAFDGTDDALKTAANPFGSEIKDGMIMLVTNIGTISNSVLFSLSGSGSNATAMRWQAEAPWGNGSIAFDNGAASGTRRVSGTSGWSADEIKLLGFYGSLTANVQQVWESGALKFGDSSGHTVLTASGMALGYDGVGRFDNCTMGEVLILNRVVGNENRQRLEGYLAHKWGLASTLPAGHPYKIAPLSGTLINLSGTASDSDNEPFTAMWSIVSAPGGFLFDDTNSLNPTLFFTEPGTYTLRLTISDGYSQRSDDVVVQVSSPSPYQMWVGSDFTHPFTLTDAMADPDADGTENLLEFAFGTDPTDSMSGPLSFIPGGELTSPGTPLLSTISGQPGAFQAIYARRKDHIAAGITFSVLFSADLEAWTASSAGLSVVTNPNSAGAMEVVSVPFPAAVPVQAGGTAPPTFFRVAVTQN